MRIGYSASPDDLDGSWVYRREFLDALAAAGHQIVLLGGDQHLDESGADLGTHDVFDDGAADVHALMVEWCQPAPGRRTTPRATQRVDRQPQLVRRYTIDAGLPTLLWDVDQGLPENDPLRSRPNVAVCEMALEPTVGATTLRYPVPDAVLDRADPTALAALPRLLPLLYVGDQCGRDEAFDALFAPAARQLTHRVAGMWPSSGRWPWVDFTDRVEAADVAPMYQETLATVLLLPERYARVGHMTSRWVDALLAGCVPIVPTDTAQVETFGPAVLRVATGEDVIERVRWLLRIAASTEHADLIATCLTYLEPFRASHQVRTVSRVLAALTQ